ncbi:hypothetical protein M2271_003373 [Streptomyces sp. LBL]|uniref:hypothetical protein n=1 Tax=Streptomyces sp. LBL TaxID=2940562 RepID=UPI0024754552|nr:hypothetical protein [Streptomyces sp. LBL]MDH6625562.1 hypothetical protein [Streptomyces sp. LBL]
MTSVHRSSAAQAGSRSTAQAARRSARAVRRSVLLFLPALCALASCGIPATDVVEAGGPASGVVPMIRVYFVADGALVGVPRRTVAPVDVESAVEMLLQGPTGAERAGGITTGLPSAMAPPTRAPAPSRAPTTDAPTTDAPATDAPATDALATDAPTEVPQEARTSGLVQVTVREDRVSIEITGGVDRLNALAAAQLTCTAVAAQRVADPAGRPAPVTVTGPDGRPLEGTGARCPDPSASLAPRTAEALPAPRTAEGPLAPR